MELALFQVDAFTNQVFKGNPAAVCPLQQWLPDSTLQAIALENNLSETVFFVGGDGKYQIRWFTPTVEAKLCGHATLAAAYVIFHFLEKGLSAVSFESRVSGPLSVSRQGSMLELDFPNYSSKSTAVPGFVSEALGFTPVEYRESSRGTPLALLSGETQVRDLKPMLAAVEASGKSLCVTARGTETDYVYRYFAPAQGIPEDPVTGSANCFLAPLWGEKLGKSEMRARQLSKRGGDLRVALSGDRVKIAGEAVLYLEGKIRF